MAMDRTEFIEVLKDSYSAYYDIISDVVTELPLAFRADYRDRDEHYWFTKSAKVWANERNEFAYIFSAERFDPALIEQCFAYALDDGLPRVRPHKEHQCTNIKVVFLADALDQDSIKAVQKKRFTKNYKFGLHGFTNLLAGAVSLEEQKTLTNREGHDLAAYFKKLFAARTEKPGDN